MSRSRSFSAAAAMVATVCVGISMAPPVGAGQRGQGDAVTLASAGAAPAWLERFPATSPPGTSAAAMAYDSNLERVVMFGGVQSSPGIGTEVTNEMWTWDGSSWTLLDPGSGPAPRTNFVFAYDPVREELVLFGGYTAAGDVTDTWVYADNGWTLRTPASAPSQSQLAMMDFDPRLGQLVMFGGYAGGVRVATTWTWDGTTWVELDPASSPPRTSFSDMTLDPSRNALVLFGGETNAGLGDDTWKWNGRRWKQLSLDRSPPARSGHAMATFGRHLVTFGGSGLDGARGTWILKRSTWKKLDVESPPRRNRHVMEWDSRQSEVVLFGGSSLRHVILPSETWTLKRGLPR